MSSSFIFSLLISTVTKSVHVSFTTKPVISGTTSKVAKELDRNSVGYEIDLEIKGVISKKVGYNNRTLTDDKVEIIMRKDAQHLRTSLQEKVKKQRSVTK